MKIREIILRVIADQSDPNDTDFNLVYCGMDNIKCDDGMLGGIGYIPTQKAIDEYEFLKDKYGGIL